jgi:hypothetical protein
VFDKEQYTLDEYLVVNEAKTRELLMEVLKGGACELECMLK